MVAKSFTRYRISLLFRVNLNATVIQEHYKTNDFTLTLLLFGHAKWLQHFVTQLHVVY
jgi:hypothetical protein